MSLETLKKCKSILCCIGVGIDPLILCSIEVPSLFVKFFCAFTHVVMFYIPLILYLLEQSVTFSYMNSAFYLFIGATLILLIYIDLMRNDLHIQRMLDHLEQVILKSE